MVEFHPFDLMNNDYNLMSVYITYTSLGSPSDFEKLSRFSKVGKVVQPLVFSLGP